MPVQPLRHTGIIERHHAGLARFVVIPIEKVEPWQLEGTTIVDATINGTAIGRRSLKHWPDQNAWWIDLSEPVCRKAGVDVGDQVDLTLTIATTELPVELTALLKAHAGARALWGRMTPSQRRMVREHVAAARQPDTRARRAAQALRAQ